MPELPDLTVYAERIVDLAGAQTLRALRVLHPFVLRTVDPAPAAFVDQPLRAVTRVGKRLALRFGSDLYAVVHLMRAGRLRWTPPGRKGAPRGMLLAFEFDAGTLALTEAGTRRSASLHLVRGQAALHALDAGGLEPLGLAPEAFAARLRSENHVLKRALTDPRLFAGIGGAYADEILHRARLSPMALSQRLSREESGRLHAAVLDVLAQATARLRAEAAALGAALPDVTAFRPDMAVHGKFGQACPDCGAPVQRIVYADRETNYCAPCQTGGRVLADRSLSRLLKDSFPRSLNALDE